MTEKERLQLIKVTNIMIEAGYFSSDVEDESKILKEIDFTVNPPVLTWRVPIDNVDRIAAQALFDSLSLVPMKPRPLLAILDAINLLTGTQKHAIGADLFGVTKKWATNVGPNRGSMFLIYKDTQQEGITQNNLNLAKMYGAAMYTQDNPTYLINPSFSPLINIPGEEPDNA